ncbi:hypothetical protein [Mesorhizobium sp. M0243]
MIIFVPVLMAGIASRIELEMGGSCLDLTGSVEPDLAIAVVGTVRVAQ